MKPINVACWSIGEHAQRNILPAIQESESVNLVGVYTRNDTTKYSQANKYSCISYRDVEDLLCDSDVEVVYISSPTSAHFEQIRKCLDAGKSVLVEKTALPTVKQAEFCCRLAREKGLVILEGFMYRFHLQFDTLISMISSGKYGKVKKIDCEFGFPHLQESNIRYRKDLDGGALFDAGAYTISSIRQLMGNDARVVSSVVTTDAPFDIDTRGMASFEKGGIYGVASWGFGLSYSNKIKIWTSNAIIEVERAYSKREEPYKINVSANGQLIEEIRLPADNHFVKMFGYLAKAVRSSSIGEDCLSDLEQQSLLLNKVRECGI